MNILFVSCKYRLFDRLDCGAANRSTMFVKALSKIGNVDVISFCKDPVKSNIENCSLVWNEYLLQNESIVMKIKRALTLLFLPLSPFGYYKQDKLRENVVLNQLRLKHYDIIACRYIEDAVSCGLWRYSNKLVVDVDDNLVGVCKRITASIKFFNIGKKLLYFWKTIWIGAMSKKVLRHVACSYYSNLLDPPFKKSIYLHNVVSISHKLPDLTEDVPKRLLIVGWLDYFPNKYGVTHFVENIFPKIRNEVPDVELHIVGKTKDNDFLSRLNAVKGVKALGYVENIKDEYENCRVVIIPIYHGAGTSVKFIEAMMMNRAIVSTIMGARGFDNICLPGEHYLLAEDDSQFFKKTVLLLKSVKLCNDMSNRSYDVGEDNLSQKKFCEIIKESIKGICKV